MIPRNEHCKQWVIKVVGNENREEIIADIQDSLFHKYDFKHIDINPDRTSLILHGDQSKLGKYGYSRDLGWSEIVVEKHFRVFVKIICQGNR